MKLDISKPFVSDLKRKWKVRSRYTDAYANANVTLCYAHVYQSCKKQQSAEKINVPHEPPSSLPSGLLGIPSPLLKTPALPFLSGV